MLKNIELAVMLGDNWSRPPLTTNFFCAIVRANMISCGRIVVIEKEHNITPNTMETINIWGELSEATDANNCPDKHVRNAILSTSDRAKIIEGSKKAIVFDEKKKMESNNSIENLGF